MLLAEQTSPSWVCKVAQRGRPAIISWWVCKIGHRGGILWMVVMAVVLTVLELRPMALPFHAE